MEWTFTEAERHTIDGAYKKMNDGESITAEEMQLIIKFTQYETAMSEETKAKQAAIEAEAQAKIEQARATQELARDNLMALSQAAMAQYERMCNGA